MLKKFLHKFRFFLLGNLREERLSKFFSELIIQYKLSDHLRILDYGSGFHPNVILYISEILHDKGIKAEINCTDFYSTEELTELNNLYQNITLENFNNNSNNENFDRAINLSMLNDLVSSNKKGKFLNVGERGGQISGGQKQRIGIARAIYRNHRLLILDESTSALDSYTEKFILNNLKRLCKEEGMTIILISHRLRTLKICDEIFFIENGQLKAHDNFENLCEKSENLTVGHFIGFSLSKNSTVGTKSTDIESIGLQVGVYFVDNITEDLFVDGYLAASLLTNKMEVTTVSMTAEADYVSRMGAAGAAVTGSFDIDRWEILPTLALDYSSVSSQDASFEVTFGGGNSNELSSPGNVKQLSLTFSPDFRTSFDYYNGYWAQGSTFSLKPKFTCQRINQDTITRVCGQGAALSVITQDEKAMQTLSFTLGVDKISTDTTYLANALYKFEF